MKKLISLLVFLIAVNLSFAQDKKFSATLSYPLTIGDNFLEAYTGYVDIGAQYRFLDFRVVQVGVSANISLLGLDNPEIANENLSGTLVYPRLFAEFPLGREGEFRPIVGLGYGINSLEENDDRQGLGVMQVKNDYKGLILNIGASYDIWESLFVIAQFDWADIDRGSFAQGAESFGNRGMLIKLGAGYRF
jgi:opacity protein-like surface antigen